MPYRYSFTGLLYQRSRSTHRRKFKILAGAALIIGFVMLPTTLWLATGPCLVNYMVLEKELALFERIKIELLKKFAGKFALIHGEEFVGAFDNPDNAYNEGVTRFGREPFLVKKITT
jgi:hypothetical protein